LNKIVIGLIILVSIVYGLCSILYPIKYSNYIVHYSRCFDIDSSIVASVINCESGYNANAKSSAGAMGLMQIMPATGEYLAELLGLTDFEENKLLDVRYNIMLGTFYLSILYKKYKDIPTMLASYNAGPGKVDKWLKDTKYSTNQLTLSTTPYPETNAYIEKVQKNIKIYLKIYNEKH